MLAKTLQFDRADSLSGFKRRTNVVRRILTVISNEERASSHKRIFSFLLSERFIRRLARPGRSINKLVVARPERKLVYQVLGFDQVDRRMPGPFDALVANSLHFSSHRFPTTPTIAWIGPDKMNHLRQTQDAGTAQNIGIERKETEQETKNNGRRRENSDAVLFDPLDTDILRSAGILR